MRWHRLTTSDPFELADDCLPSQGMNALRDLQNPSSTVTLEDILAGEVCPNSHPFASNLPSILVSQFFVPRTQTQWYALSSHKVGQLRIGGQS